MATKRVSKRISESKDEVVTSVVSPPVLKTTLFPKINRFITERWKLVATSFVSGLILTGIVFESLSLYKNIQKESRAKFEHDYAVSELKYWKSSLGKYQDSRDVYYKIATLEYRLGNSDESREYLKKALQLDPNFEQGYVLGAKVGL